MRFMNWIKTMFGGSSEGAAIAAPSETQFKPEVRVPFEDPDIQRLLPPSYRIEFVKHSQSTIYFDPDEWALGEYSDLGKYDNDRRFSIEVMSQFGKPVAAVGWYFERPDSSIAYTIGTYVASHLRRRGLAKALWRAMIRVCGVPRVDGCAATDEGFTLLRAMKEAFPDVVSFQGENSVALKDLRGKGRAA